MSIIGLILGPLVQDMHLTDWWNPNFLFNSFIKIEDLLFGFSVAGVASAVANIIWINKTTENSIRPLYAWFITIITLFLLFGLHYWFQMHSFWSSLIASVFGAMTVAILRPSSILPMFSTGLFMVTYSVPGYFLGILINPAWIHQEWLLQNLSGITLNSIPIEEFIWFFSTGIIVAAFQIVLFQNKSVISLKPT